MARYNDLESGFEKNLALAYGRHIMVGYSIEHVVTMAGRTVLKVALGDGAPLDDGEGAWCGPEIVVGPSDCTPENLDSVTWDSLVNITELGTGELEKEIPDGELGEYDAHAYSKSWPGDQCFNIQWEQTALRHTQRLFVVVDEVGATEVPPLDSTANGWFFSVISGDNPGVAQIEDGVPASLLSYDLPLGVRIYGDGTGNGELNINVGGIPPDQDWSGSLGTGFTYDETQPQRIHVGIAGLDGDPVPTAASIQLAVASEEGGGIEPGGICSMEVIYDGETIEPANWHFHPGTLSTGKNDPVQGIDSFFPNGLTYTGTAYITVMLPEYIEGDPDPSKLAVIAYTSQIADYDSAGAVTEIAYSPNPARVKANMLKRAGQHGRIDWESFIHSKDYYSEEISAPVGTDNNYTPFSGTPDFTTVGPITAAGGAINRSSGGNNFDNEARTVQRIVGGDDGHFRVTIGGAFPTGTGGGTMHLSDSAGTPWFGIAWGNGHISIFANEVSIDDITEPYDFPAEAGDVIELAIDSGFFELKQNGVTLEIPQGNAVAPNDVDLFGEVTLYASGASVTASHFQGSEVGSSTPAVVMIPRFEAHPVFTGPVDVGTALDFVDSLCASDTQEAGRYIVFLTPESRASVHTFDDEINVVGEIKLKSTDVRQRPNRLWAKYRNLDLTYLDPDSVDDRRDELFDRVGRPIDPGALNFASMRKSQAQRLIRFEMRRRSDRKKWAELRGMPDSLKVLPADVTSVVTSKIRVRVSTGYNDAAVSVVLAADEGSKLTPTPFFATWWNKTDYPNSIGDPNLERIQVTAVVGDTLTVVRGQESTVPSTKNTAGKTYAIGRYPKQFMVITATREPNLEREFTMREYLPDDYRDTDHDVPQSIVTPEPPGTVPPGPILILEQSSSIGVGGTTVTKILGTVYFGTWASPQTARIYVTKPEGTEIDTGIVVSPNTGTNVGTFEYIPDVVGLYTFRAVAQSLGVIGGEDIETIDIEDLIFNPTNNESLVNPTNDVLITVG